MACLESLPAPLPLLIAKALPDIKALDALRRSSSLFAEIFALHAVELLEHLLATLHEETAVELRAYVLLVADRSTWQHTPDAIKGLHESAQTSLDNSTPAAAVSLALRTFSRLHSLCTHIAIEKLDELYALPHRHAERRIRKTEDFHTLTGTLYEIPARSPLHWIEEQRIIQSLIQIRSYALLGLGAPQPPLKQPYVVQCSIVQESYHFFRAHLDDITCERVSGDIRCWQAPATIPTQPNGLDPLWPSELELSCITNGWKTFHIMCLRGATPFTEGDWSVFRDLGLGLWSYERLAGDLELVVPPRWLRDLRAAHARERGIGYEV
ncbi:hypothetical protein LTR56_017176 [Elasticomyces elasticus]|nr:hypothetical protein LTR56_017176 [Elasticomyces elasticus]KAK3666292.1 hypothetical protein LTR22_002956 [Elasticomyces elasticus]KAK4926888.1 hypothetical protein LTR49_006304 [Elasticomyces elasticus]KAK5752681.1 hypothetical protein LTS12_017250 [Elasticomyces elasticus]